MVIAVVPGRRQRKWQEVHQNLLDAAGVLFRTHGVAGTTVDDIAQAADVARQTVFNHFPYKEAFALDLAHVGVSHVARQASILLETGVSALDVLRRTCDHLLEAAIAQGDLAVIVARELLHPDAVRAARAAERIPVRQVVEVILQKAYQEETVRDDLPLPIVASRVTATVLGVLMQVTTREAADLRQELAVCFDIVCNGISERRI